VILGGKFLQLAAQLMLILGHGCAHKASRTRDCEYPMVTNRQALKNKKLGNEEEYY